MIKWDVVPSFCNASNKTKACEQELHDWLIAGLRRRITCSALYKTSALRASIAKCSMTLIPRRWPCPCLSWSRSVTLSTGKRRLPASRQAYGGSDLASGPATRPQNVGRYHLDYREKDSVSHCSIFYGKNHQNNYIQGCSVTWGSVVNLNRISVEIGWIKVGMKVITLKE